MQESILEYMQDYRSDVAIAMYQEDFYRLKAVYLEKAEKEPTKYCGPILEAFHRCFEDDNVEFKTGYQFYTHPKNWSCGIFVALTFKNVLWYPYTAPGVKLIHSFLQELGENYQFLRVGQDPDDVEYVNKAAYWSLVTPRTVVHREIAVP